MVKKFSYTIFFNEKSIIIYFFFLKIFIHLINPEYGYHRDELYFLVVSENFSFDNFDVLPLTPLYLKFITFFLGNSLKALHFASSLCGALVIAILCLMVKDLGGKQYAVFIAALSILFSGFLIFGALFTYDSLDFLIWTVLIFLSIKILKENKSKWGIIFGIVFGLGLLNKLTVLFLGIVLFITLWLFNGKEFVINKGLWIGGSIAAFFFLPFFLWQTQHQWYFINFVKNYAGNISYRTSFPEFIWNQIAPNNLFNLPIWGTGLYLLLFSKRWKSYRFLGVGFSFLFILFFLLGLKFYFLLPFYTLLIAVGAIGLEEYLNRFLPLNPKLKRAKIAFPLSYVFFSLWIIPLLMPVLPVKTLLQYEKIFGVNAGVRYEVHKIDALPQHFADRFGWEELAQEIASVYHTFGNVEKKNIGILTRNWGQASAIWFYREKYILPEPISPHGWFYFKALKKQNFKKAYIAMGFSEENLKKIFGKVRMVGCYNHPYCMPYENNKKIYFCEEPQYEFKNLWILLGPINSEI